MEEDNSDLENPRNFPQITQIIDTNQELESFINKLEKDTNKELSESL